MTDEEIAIEVLEDLKRGLHPDSDEYADISQTIHYIKTWKDV